MIQDKKNSFADLSLIARQFLIEGRPVHFEPITIGHINHTYYLKAEDNGKPRFYILQQVNTEVFRNPVCIMENMAKVARHLEENKYPRKILKPVSTLQQLPYFKNETGEYWRIFPYFDNTITLNSADSPELAFEIALNFGEYARFLHDLDPDTLVETIPHFHHTPLRFKDFQQTLKNTRKDHRQEEAASAINLINQQEPLLYAFKQFSQIKRVVHYDTKINNILLDKDSLKGVCVIDLDTVMPGMLPYDFGDMVRTICPPVDENDADLSKISVRPNILEALYQGFMEGIQDAIHPIEKANLYNGANLIVYEQAIRFLKDFLEGDLYYPVDYENQNLIRARNQLVLLQDLLRLTGYR